jgi:hypothetical protein
MSRERSYPWTFTRRLRRGAFGWRSQPAVQRVKEAVSEIRKVARKEPLVGAEGAVRFFEKVSPALEHVDSSSGALGGAVNRAVEQLVPIIAGAPADATTRGRWLTRLWDAYQADEMPYIEHLGGFWGELCRSPEVASRWADELIGTVRMAWSPDPKLRGFFKGTSNCLSALFAAGRYPELLDLLELAPFPFWPDRRWGVRALVALGRKAEALRYAEASEASFGGAQQIAQECEEILLSSGLADEAYRRCGLAANRKGTFLATYRAVAKKYPDKDPAEILHDLAATTPGQEGTWFAAAKDAGLYERAVELAQSSPCDPRTLARAARDFTGSNPAFAVEAGLAALHWLVEGHGYDITGADVLAAYRPALRAAEALGRADVLRARVRSLISHDPVGDGFVAEILTRELGPEKEAHPPAGSTIRELLRPHLLAGHLVVLVGGVGVALDPEDLDDECTDGFELPGYLARSSPVRETSFPYDSRQVGLYRNSRFCLHGNLGEEIE